MLKIVIIFIVFIILILLLATVKFGSGLNVETEKLIKTVEDLTNDYIKTRSVESFKTIRAMKFEQKQPNNQIYYLHELLTPIINEINQISTAIDNYGHVIEIRTNFNTVTDQNLYAECMARLKDNRSLTNLKDLAKFVLAYNDCPLKKDIESFSNDLIKRIEKIDSLMMQLNTIRGHFNWHMLEVQRKGIVFIDSDGQLY
jgi:hypothetical protein